MRPQMIEQSEVAGKVEICAGEHKKKRRAVDAAVIAAKRNFAEVGHFSTAGFVEDLSWLSLVLVIHFGCLRRSQKLQDSLGEVWSNPEHLHCCDDSVTAEDCAEPRHSCLGIIGFWSAKGHHLDVGERAANPAAETIIGTGDLARTGRGCFEFRLGPGHRTSITHRTPTIPRIAVNRQVEFRRFAGAEVSFEAKS